MSVDDQKIVRAKRIWVEECEEVFIRNCKHVRLLDNADVRLTNNFAVDISGGSNHFAAPAATTSRYSDIAGNNPEEAT